MDVVNINGDKTKKASISEEIMNEIRKEKRGKYKEQLKGKIKQLVDAEELVSSLRKEIQVLELEVEEKLS